MDRTTRFRLASELIALARAHAPFYRVRLRPEADFCALPITEREDVAAHLADMVTDPRVREALRAGTTPPRSVIVTQTGGSGGEPLRVVVERKTILAEARIPLEAIEAWNARRHAWTGDPVLTVLTTPASAYRAQHLWRHLRARRRHVVPVDLPFGDLVTRLNRIRTDVLFAYASMLRPLLVLTDAGLLRSPPRLVVAAAERLPERDRRDVKRVWGADVIHGWGSSETGLIAMSRGEGAMHVLPDVILETTPHGEALVTSLRRRLLPLIRYRLGDSITMRGDRVLDVLPRAERPFLYGPGIVVPTDDLREPLDTAGGVLEYGVRQTRDGVELSLARLPDADVETLRERVRNVLREHGLERPRVRMRFVDRVARTSHAGKLVRFTALQTRAQ